MVRVSVVIVTYNSENHIYNCIDSIIKNNDIGDQLEIIIVDNNSPNVDFMFQSISGKYGCIVKLIKNKQNGGYGQGNNVGVKSALGDIVLIMNPDVRLIQPVFKDALNYFFNKEVIVVGMQQLFTLEKKASSFFIPSISDSLIISCLNRFFRRLNFFISAKMCFEGACFFIKKDCFERIGLFDENIFMYGEEMDVFFRIPRGKRQVYAKKLSYLHLAGERKWSLNTLKRTYISRLYLCEKYRKNPRILFINAWIWNHIRRILNQNGYGDIAESWNDFLMKKK